MSAPASILDTLKLRIGRSVANWSRRRHGIDHAPLTLTHRRIYILPTRLGLLYAGVVIAMGIGGMNYANNLALMLAFLLGAMGMVAMHHTQRNLSGLCIHNAGNEAVFAGQQAMLNLPLENPSTQSRLSIQARVQWLNETIITEPIMVDAQQRAILAVPLVAVHRGWLRLERITLFSRYPFGLFHGWAVLHLPLRCLIYPRPSERSLTPPPLGIGSERERYLARGDDEFAGLRDYQQGDSLKHVDWKAYAREQGLLVKHHASNASSSHEFDWDALPNIDSELRLSILTRWILDAHAQGIAYGLKLPGFHAPVALSDMQRQQCLSALALYGLPTDNASAGADR